MKAVYFLKWITPMISQQEIEKLLAWVNTHLEQIHAEKINSLAKVKIIPLLEITSEPALLISIPCLLTQDDSEKLREAVWTEILAKITPGAPPEAVSIQSETLSNTPKKLFTFDMDSTLINEEVIDELARENGFYDQVAAITEEAMQGKIDFKTALFERCKLLSGLKKDRALGIINQLNISPGGESLFKWLKLEQINTAVVSGGFEFILKHFQKQLFIDQVYGHHLETDFDDSTQEAFFTGLVNEPIIDAAYKQKLVAQLKSNYELEKNQTVVIGDGANDMLMMGEAGVSVSFCGKPKLATVTNTLILNRNLMWVKALI